MSKKTFFLFILILILLIVGFGWYFIFGAPARTPSVAPIEPAGQNLFPFGQGPATSTRPAKPAGTSTPPVIDISGGTEAPALRQIATAPVAGAAFVVPKNASGTEAVRYVDRATGHIFETPVDSLVQKEISNVTIPEVAEALWGNNAANVVLRYLKDDGTIQSFSASINGQATGTTPAITGVFLPQNIRTIAAQGGSIMYFDPTVQNGRLVRAAIDGSKKAALMNSDFGEWALSWNNPKTALIYTKPSGTASGSGYLVNLATGALSNVTDNVIGLAGTLNPTGDYAFLSAAQGSGIASAAYTVAKKTVSVLPINTLADKCAWSNTEKTAIYCGVPSTVADGTYPDDWYKGSVSFVDRLWKIDVSTGDTTIILDPTAYTLAELDMTNLVIDPTDSYILFMNKSDLSLWSYKLK